MQLEPAVVSYLHTFEIYHANSSSADIWLIFVSQTTLALLFKCRKRSFKLEDSVASVFELLRTQ